MNTEVNSQGRWNVFNTKAAADSTLPAIFLEQPRDIIIAFTEFKKDGDSKGLLPAYYQRYKWDTLPPFQKDNAVKKNNLLSKEIQQKVIDSLPAVTTKEGAEVVVAPKPIQNENTNKHDEARIIELFCDPNYISTWTDAMSPHEDRAKLDDK